MGISLGCLFFGHSPSHFVDDGRQSIRPGMVIALYWSRPKPVCGRCNCELDETYYNDKLPEVIPAGVV
jgi:hypothetical protein